MRVGLFFGSFNPVHVGHLVIANYMASFTELDEVWFVVSPQNPLKEKSTLLNENDRLHLVKLALDLHPKIKASDIEFKLAQPSYTINTLAHLNEKFPQHEFCLIMGSDNLSGFKKWKNYEEILRRFKIFVYPRPEKTETEFDKHPSVTFVNAPLMEISSTFIRKAIREKKDARFYLHHKVWEYIDEMNYYKK
ncbi:MAG: nicotinate-nucleotide adenylyltransferase [Bacteroidia bacterium]|nr:nicotinate-nucleotide adenylyltransferase [Sphingobacteriaceae bacterium]MBK7309226.1 nicotinate-nucleotide adenylyltransferase [Sphingobacteriaceae bacterium]MBK7818636.1 nicotinate-nucleotide adenylyltransferase [Sphingobacteriaceae bacterium]MBP9068195.1 nicotinate-nucleotide adenylyltransferase [Bacteroidia bacterium]